MAVAGVKTPRLNFALSGVCFTEFSPTRIKCDTITRQIQIYKAQPSVKILNLWQNHGVGGSLNTCFLMFLVGFAQNRGKIPQIMFYIAADVLFIILYYGD